MKRILIALAATALPIALSAAGPGALEVLEERRSLYRNVVVYQQGDLRCMTFRGAERLDLRQSCMDLTRPLFLWFDYARDVFTGLTLVPDPERVLVIGLGGGSIPAVFRHIRPDAEITAVEIDPAVVEMADEHFGFREGPNIEIVTIDGRVYVKRSALQGKTWDYIVLDAFGGEYIPEHMLTREYLQEVASVLAPGGVVVANTFSNSGLYDNESATYAAAYDWLYNLDRRAGNRVIVAGMGEDPGYEALLEGATLHQAALADHGILLLKQVQEIDRDPDWSPDARVLTDQYSPANLLNTGER